MSIEFTVHGPGPILLVDDDSQFHTMFNFFYNRLDSANNELVNLYDAKSCIEYLISRNIKDEHFPSLVLMDLSMPIISGLDAIREIRSMEEFKNKPLINIFSSSNRPKDIEAALSAGANAYFEKPFDWSLISFRQA